MSYANRKNKKSNGYIESGEVLEVHVTDKGPS